jgi:peroxiredoxin
MDPLIKNGEPAPNFRLLDLQGELYDLESMRGWIVVMNFWSPECDWCARIDGELIAYLPEWKRNVKVWWIASNANEPQVIIKQVALERNLSTVLVDREQVVADRYGAQTTPHFFVVDAQGTLRYQGAWDDVTFRQRTATQLYVPQVIEALIQGETPEIIQSPPYGCTLVRIHEKDG